MSEESCRGPSDLGGGCRVSAGQTPLHVAFSEPSLRHKQYGLLLNCIYVETQLSLHDEAAPGVRRAAGGRQRQSRGGREFCDCGCSSHAAAGLVLLAWGLSERCRGVAAGARAPCPGPSQLHSAWDMRSGACGRQPGAWGTAARAAGPGDLAAPRSCCVSSGTTPAPPDRPGRSRIRTWPPSWVA
jgi:hypothetical protein